MNSLEEIFKKTIQTHALIKKNDSLILGVSGGPDSICMLHQFVRIRKEYRLRLVCAHFNHALRKEADAEERFIKQECEQFSIPCITHTRNVANAYRGDSLEQTARNLRFDFFLTCSRQTKIKTLALAHHKDDLAETILMRLIRGTGLKGLQGFCARSKYSNLTVIRPMLDLNKAYITQWLTANHVSYCIDTSNVDEAFLRNRLRARVLPMLKKLNPNIVDTLCGLARITALDYEFMHTLAQEKFAACRRRQTHSSIALDIKELKRLPQALFNNVVRIAIETVQGNTRRLELKHIEELRDLLLHRPEHSIVDLPGLAAATEGNVLVIRLLS